MIAAAIVVWTLVKKVAGSIFAFFLKYPVALVGVLGLCLGIVIGGYYGTNKLRKLEAVIADQKEQMKALEKESEDLAKDNQAKDEELKVKLAAKDKEYEELLEQARKNQKIKIMKIKVPYEVKVPVLVTSDQGDKAEKKPEVLKEKELEVMIEDNEVVCRKFPSVFLDQFNSTIDLGAGSVR